VYDKFVEGFTNAVSNMTLADPLKEDTFIGPMSSKAAAVNLQAQLDSAIQAGATVLVEGGMDKDKPGAWFKPAVLTDVTESMDVYREELFGPVAVVYKANDIDHAIKIANDRRTQWIADGERFNKTPIITYRVDYGWRKVEK
ncbi:hypothetical protein LCGC14_2904180, partial [marine sediment metagenome]